MREINKTLETFENSMTHQMHPSAIAVLLMKDHIVFGNYCGASAYLYITMRL